jgi:hypothetical protein
MSCLESAESFGFVECSDCGMNCCANCAKQETLKCDACDAIICKDCVGEVIEAENERQIQLCFCKACSD